MVLQPLEMMIWGIVDEDGSQGKGIEDQGGSQGKGTEDQGGSQRNTSQDLDYGTASI